jgi:hypothetical protein
MPGSIFIHIVDISKQRKQYHVKKEKDQQSITLNPGNEGTKLHKQSTEGYVRLAPAHLHNDFVAASSF